MPEPQKRQIAYKARIADLINGGYVKEEGWTPNYIITKQGKHISRINLIGTVISKTEEGSEYQSLVVDDGSGTISLRLFEKNDNVKNIEIGDVVLLIGRPREYGSEKYIVPEIIKKINNKKWIDVRKIELGIENLKTKKDELGKEEVVVEKIDDSTKEKTASNPQIVYEAVKELDPSLQDKGFSYYSPIVRLRQTLKLHTNMRPCKAYLGNPLNYRDDIDLVIFRENTEGLYSGVEFHPLPREIRDALSVHPKMKVFLGVDLNDIALSCRIFTRGACRNILRAAFEYAKKYNKHSVTVVEKPNVIRETSGLMIREARELAKEYPGIELWEANVDAMCMWLLKNPQNYGVLVSSNMFGDIISDLGAQLVGGLGFACSANIGDKYALFEPTHGSAPKYAGQYKVNPTAMLLSVKLMIEYLGEGELALRLENSIASVLKEGKVRTYDLGGNNTSLEVAKEVARKLK